MPPQHSSLPDPRRPGPRTVRRSWPEGAARGLDRARRRPPPGADPDRRRPRPRRRSRTGPGACALARLVLQDATGSAALAARYCRALTYDVIAHLPERDFELSGADVLAWLERT